MSRPLTAAQVDYLVRLVMRHAARSALIAADGSGSQIVLTFRTAEEARAADRALAALAARLPGGGA
jgi:hypothetical protein